LITKLVEARAQIEAELAQITGASNRGVESRRRHAEAIDNMGQASTALAACAAEILHPPAEAAKTIANTYGSSSPRLIAGNYSALQSVLIAGLAGLTQWLESLSERLSSTFEGRWQRLIAGLRNILWRRRRSSVSRVPQAGSRSPGCRRRTNLDRCACARPRLRRVGRCQRRFDFALKAPV
jgi:hypothetical protein